MKVKKRTRKIRLAAHETEILPETRNRNTCTVSVQNPDKFEFWTYRHRPDSKSPVFGHKNVLYK